MTSSHLRSNNGVPDPEGRLVWKKSSLSVSGDCVEWTIDSSSGRVLVRDSKDPGAGHLCFTLGEWRAFVGAVALGEADL